MSGSAADRAAKRERMAGVRRDAGGRPLVLSSHEALAWYLEGARTHVSLAGPPVLAVRIDDDGDTLFVSANEAERLIAEELLPEDADRVVRVPWHQPVLEAAGAGLAEVDVTAALRSARASLLPAEADRYRALGRETAEVLTAVARGLRASSTERSAAAALAEGLVARGIDPLVILVAGEGRLPHRHPLPTDGVLGRRAMLVVCGRRHGLIANATRWVGEAGGDDDRILEIEAAFFAATRPGARLNDVFAAGTAGYAASGFDADEWTKHHQGGPTGYAGRDPRATTLTTDAVVSSHAFAWNPSAPGAKVEDTVLVTESGIEVLTVDPAWPTVEFGGVRRPVARAFD